MGSDFTVIINEYMPLRELVFTTLRQAILKGELQPGERLMEIQLAEKMGVSRTPIREAIRKLAAEGLVTMIPRKGAIVAGISEKMLKDVLRVRMTLEKMAYEGAFENITDQAIEELRAAEAEFENAVDSGDLSGICGTGQPYAGGADRRCHLLFRESLVVSVYLVGNSLHLLGWQCQLGLGEVEVAFLVHRYKMDMGVVDFEPDDSDAYLAAGTRLLECDSHSLGKDNHLGQHLIGEVKDIVYFLLGNYKGMSGTDGVDVEEGVEIVILGALVAGYLSLDDFGEKCSHL